MSTQQEAINYMIKKEYVFFRSVELTFDAYLVDQYKHSLEYPPNLPPRLLKKMTDLHKIILQYNFSNTYKIEKPYQVIGDIIKHQFWLYYISIYTEEEEAIIYRFDTLVDRFVRKIEMLDELNSIQLIEKKSRQCIVS